MKGLRDLTTKGLRDLTKKGLRDLTKNTIFSLPLVFQSAEELERLTVDEKLGDLERAVYILR